jgi:hypothetical protein
MAGRYELRPAGGNRISIAVSSAPARARAGAPFFGHDAPMVSAPARVLILLTYTHICMLARSGRDRAARAAGCGSAQAQQRQYAAAPSHSGTEVTSHRRDKKSLVLQHQLFITAVI